MNQMVIKTSAIVSGKVTITLLTIAKCAKQLYFNNKDIFSSKVSVFLIS